MLKQSIVNEMNNAHPSLPSLMRNCRCMYTYITLRKSNGAATLIWKRAPSAHLKMNSGLQQNIAIVAARLVSAKNDAPSDVPSTWLKCPRCGICFAKIGAWYLHCSCCFLSVCFLALSFCWHVEVRRPPSPEDGQFSTAWVFFSANVCKLLAQLFSFFLSLSLSLSLSLFFLSCLSPLLFLPTALFATPEETVFFGLDYISRCA